MVDIASESIDISSCLLHCLAAGEEKNQEIILLHGMKFQAATWQELGTLKILADSGMRALALDMPGFGKSPACEAVLMFYNRLFIFFIWIFFHGKNTDHR